MLYVPWHPLQQHIPQALQMRAPRLGQARQPLQAPQQTPHVRDHLPIAVTELVQTPEHVLQVGHGVLHLLGVGAHGALLAVQLHAQEHQPLRRALRLLSRHLVAQVRQHLMHLGYVRHALLPRRRDDEDVVDVDHDAHAHRRRHAGQLRAKHLRDVRRE
jgi:hypothetical protein